MTDQITLEKAFQLVTFTKDSAGKWRVGTVHGDVADKVYGDVCGDVYGNVYGDVCGTVLGTISGKEWAFIETPQKKLARLINESGNAELIEAFNQVEDSND